ncbi:protein-disulfide isomerase [Pseudonocardia sediminis]|uniref:Protein-disulfide isomerase n=1 Tax=Pseudonocardia sediminis TaxID=1397368 RepID=A0A4Q7URV1_PSEST|nr:thioredoxin domain-containing protein [Pseudonocardia sediminis]RZT83508.1 protein-disulfide isomerase [Pseudonocardia sediminis]
MTSGKKSQNPLTARSGPARGTVLGIVAVVLFAGLVGFGVYQAQKPADVVVPPNATAAGVPIGNPSAKATIDVFLDFQCPACKQFEDLSGQTVDQLVAAGQAKVVYHPVAILDRYSPDQYSSRSSAASACAAADGVFPQYLKLLYANQPAENTPGLTAEKLTELGRQAGAGQGFAECVGSDRYAGWTTSITDQASKDGLTGTPTVKVDGEQIQQPTPDALRQAVAAAQS